MAGVAQVDSVLTWAVIRLHPADVGRSRIKRDLPESDSEHATLNPISSLSGFDENALQKISRVFACRTGRRDGFNWNRDEHGAQDGHVDP